MNKQELEQRHKTNINMNIDTDLWIKARMLGMQRGDVKYTDLVEHALSHLIDDCKHDKPVNKRKTKL